MQHLKRVVRIGLLCILAAASFNGLMVFLFFDGTNFINHQSFQWMRENIEDRANSYKNNIRYLEKKVGATKRNEEDKYQVRLKLLEEKYQHLDTVIHSSHLIYRQPIPSEYIEKNLKPDHPFTIAQEVLSICVNKDCFYAENLPRYVDLQFFKDKTALQPRRLGGRNQYKLTGNFPLNFSLAKKSGPFELWEAYWKTSDSLYEYYSNYLINTNEKRLLRKDISMDRRDVFLREASPSGKYLLLDHGCCSSVRGMSVIQENGISILDTTYIDGATPIWKQDTLIFFSPIKEVSVQDDDCSKDGLPSILSIKLYFIDGMILNTNEKRVFCGQ